MAFLSSVPLRLFLICWIVFSLFFSTNIVREHYPAFTLIEHGNFRCDEYLGWHAVFGLALIPLSLTLIAFYFLAKDSPKQNLPYSVS